MSQLTYAQLESVWLSAAKGTKYATRTWAALMAAIGMAESSGETDVTNPNDNNGTQTSWGVWQISNGDHSQPSPNWNNPYVNAQLAIAKLNDQGLSAWGTYDSGAYKAYLSGQTTPDPNGITGGSAAAASALSAQQAASSDCLWKLGQLSVPIVPGLYTQTISPGWCIISRSQMRGMIGAALMTAGGLVAGVGVVLLAILAGAGPVSREAQKLTAGGKLAGLGSRAAAASGGGAGETEPPPGAADIEQAQQAPGTMRREITAGERPPVRPGRRTATVAAPSAAARQAARRRAVETRAAARRPPGPSPGGRRVAGTRRRASERPPTRAEAGF